RQIASGTAVAPAASAVGTSEAPVAPALPAAIAKAAAPAIISLRERRMLAALHRRCGLGAAFLGRCVSGSGNLKGLAFERRDRRGSLNGFNGRDAISRVNTIWGCRYWFRNICRRRRDHAAVDRGRRIDFTSPRLRLV